MEIVGDYEYSSKDLIGHGAFAVVFKGRLRQNPSCTVAIKSITKKSLAKSQNLLGKEIKILKELTELHHENVVALLDCKESANNVYLVMEYCNGGDLADYLHAKGTLSEDTIRLFLIQLAGAMRALYAKGIVHRDLKPQNILLSHSGAKAHPQPSEIKLKIADFGFARFLQDGVMAATLCGSPMYMAPEVIMSLQYDAKADLWSLGTIVFQCLTGKAPFQATTPQALKQFYEKNANLSPKIAVGTSPELSELLMGLLKRNARERMNFESFFNHKFLKRPDPPQSQSPLQGELPLPIYGSPPTLSKLPRRASTPIKVATPPISQPESPRSTRNALSSSPEDDYVIVPQNIQIQSDHSPETSVEKEKPTFRLPVRASPMPCAPVTSPTRPSFLPISEPIPVPTQRQAFEKIYTETQLQKRDKEEPPSPSQVQFVIGTPPGGRRRSTSGSLCETPPPPSIWTVSPVSTSKTMPTNSPLKRSGTSPPILSGPLARVPMLSSPNLNDNNNLGRSPVIPFCTRAVTLPEISELDNYPTFFNETSTTNDAHPITFLAPELPEETLLERVAPPLAALVDAAQLHQPTNETARRAEQLVLMVRALQLLSSGLSLATRQLKAGQLRPSTSVKNVVTTLNTKFRATLQECKQLNNTGLLNKVGTTTATADKILYNHAIQMCQSAALDELFGNPEECFQRYQTAQILLHSLSQQVQNQKDKMLLTKYKEAVEKRLYVLQQQGYIYATDLS
ncbi:unnamed protein product [Phaedon cochleariae]|uniref:Protein kinase domain-containing protein n=1 Tax=Phaedon cochleariae TaxID=80249 RepID=A0A9N9X5C1_PHACE|nr:unnamed protein product [Phaedon cochleariae]